MSLFNFDDHSSLIWAKDKLEAIGVYRSLYGDIFVKNVKEVHENDFVYFVQDDITGDIEWSIHDGAKFNHPKPNILTVTKFEKRILSTLGEV